MFAKLKGWIKSLFSKEAQDPLEIYKLKERLIYSYFNGQKIVSADPVVLYKRLMTKWPELIHDYKLSNSQHTHAAKAHDGLIKNYREVFQVKSYEEGGLTESETQMLFEGFLYFCDEVKKKSNPGQTPQKATSAPSESSLPENPPTPNSSGSGCAESAPRIDSSDPSN